MLMNGKLTAALFPSFLWVGKSWQFLVAFRSLDETNVCLFTVNKLLFVVVIIHFSSIFFSLLQWFNQLRVFFFYKKDYLEFLTAIFIYLQSLVLLLLTASKLISVFHHSSFRCRERRLLRFFWFCLWDWSSWTYHSL